MDNAVGYLVQGLAALLVLAFYLLVGGVVVAVCWSAFHRVSADATPRPSARKDRLPQSS